MPEAKTEDGQAVSELFDEPRWPGEIARLVRRTRPWSQDHTRDVREDVKDELIPGSGVNKI